MAIINLTIPDAILSRVVTALASQVGWTATLPDGTANPETQAQAAKRAVIQYMKQIVIHHEVAQASHQAEVTANSTAESQITIS